jgi:hypothetical protein
MPSWRPITAEQRATLRALTPTLTDTTRTALRDATRYILDADPDDAPYRRLVLSTWLADATTTATLTTLIERLHLRAASMDATTLWQSILLDLDHRHEIRQLRTTLDHDDPPPPTPTPTPEPPPPPTPEPIDRPPARTIGPDPVLGGRSLPPVRTLPAVLPDRPTPEQLADARPTTTGLCDADIDDCWRLIHAGGDARDYVPHSRRVPKHFAPESPTPGFAPWLLPEDPRHPHHHEWIAQQRQLRLPAEPITPTRSTD